MRLTPSSSFFGGVSGGSEIATAPYRLGDRFNENIMFTLQRYKLHMWEYQYRGKSDEKNNNQNTLNKWKKNMTYKKLTKDVDYLEKK